MERILVIRFSSMGDLVLTTGPLRYVKAQHPKMVIDCLTSEMGQEILGKTGLINRFYILPKGAGIKSIASTLWPLEKYDAIIDLQGNLKSWLTRLFVQGPYFCIEKHSKERRAFVKKRKYKELLQQHVCEKYLATFQKALYLGEPSLSQLRPVYSASTTLFSKLDNKKLIALHPYASQKNKIWPHFPKLVDALLEQGYSLVIVGADDSPLDLNSHPQLLNLTNKTNLQEMASIIQSSQALVSTDSGPMHLGVALKVPTLALFGPTTKEFGFYPQFEDTKVIEKPDLSCRPCHVHGGDICPLGHHKCMEDITVDQVVGALKLML